MPDFSNPFSWFTCIWGAADAERLAFHHNQFLFLFFQLSKWIFFTIWKWRSFVLKGILFSQQRTDWACSVTCKGIVVFELIELNVICLWNLEKMQISEEVGEKGHASGKRGLGNKEREKGCEIDVWPNGERWLEANGVGEGKRRSCTIGSHYTLSFFTLFSIQRLFCFHHSF